MKKISAIILAKNEEKLMPACLNSIKWVDEIIIVDAGSTDKTIEISKNKGCKVISSEWLGFSKSRNKGAEAASHDWLLYVDADERVSGALKKEIQNLMSKHEVQFNSYKIPRKNYLLGKLFRFGGWYPEPQHRLIKKTSLKGWVGDLHEHPEVEGSIGLLKNDLVHLTHRGMKQMLTKTLQYTRLEAELRLKSNHPKVRVIHLFSAPAREIWKRGIIKGGWRDGIEGFIEILYQAFNQFLIMVWLWELQRGKSMEKTYEDLDASFEKENQQ